MKRELLDLRLGAKKNGSDGDKYIMGAQFVASGNSVLGGKILIMHSYNVVPGSVLVCGSSAQTVLPTLGLTLLPWL